MAHSQEKQRHVDTLGLSFGCFGGRNRFITGSDVILCCVVCFMTSEERAVEWKEPCQARRSNFGAGDAETRLGGIMENLVWSSAGGSSHEGDVSYFGKSRSHAFSRGLLLRKVKIEVIMCEARRSEASKVYVHVRSRPLRHLDSSTSNSNIAE